MALRTIRHAAFSFRVTAPDPVREGQTIVHEKKALQGETVDIPFEDDLQRGEKFGAFVTPDTPAAASVIDSERETLEPPEENTEGEEEELSVSDMTDEELVTWIQEDRPNVQTVDDAAEGDPEQAKRLLDAEDAASGGDSRKGVIDGLTAIISHG